MSDRVSGTSPTKFDVGGDERDDLFDMLSHSRRRFTLQHLKSAETPLLVEELVTKIMANENHRPMTPDSGADREAIEVSLRHAHLPKMADGGFVRYDVSDQMVTLADRADEAWALL